MGEKSLHMSFPRANLFYIMHVAKDLLSSTKTDKGDEKHEREWERVSRFSEPSLFNRAFDI